jgi:glycosyltransferase involved in cell wall biosynthesis
MSDPWLSVLMPTYNGGRYLRQALESVRAEGDRRVELVAVDDGSTDGTAAILSDFAQAVPTRIVRVKHTGNWAANTNLGLAVARAKHVCLLHQDDVWLPGRLAAVRRLITAFPGAALYLHASRFVDEAGGRLGVWRCPLPAGRAIPPADLLDRLLVQNFLAASAPVFRRDAALRAGGLDPELWYAADWDLWLTLAQAGDAVYLPSPLLGFRLHPWSQTVIRCDRLEQIRDQLDRVLARHLGAAGDKRPLLARVCRFSVAFNLALFAAVRQRPSGWIGLAREFAGLGPHGWWWFLRDSRAAERVKARARLYLRVRSREAPPHQ